MKTNIGSVINITGNAEDMIIHVHVSDAEHAVIATRDMLTGKCWEKECSTKEAGAILALMVAGDEVSYANELYSIAEKVLEGVENSLRPIA